MLSALLTRIRGQWPIFALGLATPVLAVGALLVQSDRGADSQEVSTSQAMLPHLASGASSSPGAPTQQYRPLDPIETTTTVAAAPTDGATAEPTTTAGTTASTGSSKGSTSKAGSARKTTTTLKKAAKGSTSGAGSSSSGGSSSGGSSSGSGSGSGGSPSGGSGGSGSGGTGGGGGTTTTAPVGPPAALLSDDFGSWSGAGFHTGDAIGAWRVRSDGGGQVTGSGRMTLVPLADDNSSNSAWVTTASAFGDLDLRADVTTTAQLHSSPSDDDAARVVFHGATGSDAYVLVLGTTSSRLDRVIGGNAVTLDSSGLGVGVGTTAAVRVLMVGSHIDVWIGFSHVLSVVDSSPRGAGPLGFGAVDANVDVDNVVVRDA